MERKCDFCGHSSADVTLMASPPNQEFKNFCESNNCFQNYSNYVINDDKSQGIPFSIAVERQKIHCDWCGSKSPSVERLNDMRDLKSRFQKYKYMHSYFCPPYEKKCAKNYSRFIFARDLSKGLPYSVRKQIFKSTSPFKPNKHYQCAYCGKENARVIYNPWTEENLKAKTFCKNKTCYENFYIYSTIKFPKIPYAFKLDKPPVVRKKRATEQKPTTTTTTTEKVTKKRGKGKQLNK
jgi:hypothetical protein